MDAPINRLTAASKQKSQPSSYERRSKVKNKAWKGCKDCYLSHSPKECSFRNAICCKCNIKDIRKPFAKAKFSGKAIGSSTADRAISDIKNNLVNLPTRQPFKFWFYLPSNADHFEKHFFLSNCCTILAVLDFGHHPLRHILAFYHL